MAFNNDFTKPPIGVGSGGFIVNSGAGDNVWVARDYFCADCNTILWYEAGLNGPTGASIELARSAFPVAAIERGLMWQTPSGIFVGRSRSSASKRACRWPGRAPAGTRDTIR